MRPALESLIVQATGASSFVESETLQELWSGYGKIKRVLLQGAAAQSIIVKHVQLPNKQHHPRGWNTSISHQRKVKSYEVEAHWYQTFSKSSAARVPNGLAVKAIDGEVFLLLEDLDGAGFPLRKTQVNWAEISTCLAWLADFHASFLGVLPKGLWETGTYWHLATRPDELAALTDKRLQAAAPLIDERLNSCRHQTLVHGDAKLANFCFAPDGQVAGLDFQYVGAGCGMKDLAYFVGSCLYEEDCERLEDEILDTYFTKLQAALGRRNQALEEEWRSLYHVAWADFHRFLKGWSPGHWKLNSYSERVTAEVIRRL